MSLLIFILIVLVVLCLALYACSLIPVGDRRIIGLIQIVCVAVAILAIVQRAGLA